MAFRMMGKIGRSGPSFSLVNADTAYPARPLGGALLVTGGQR